MTLPTNKGLGVPKNRDNAADADREVAKLTATFLNGLAVGLAVVGGVAPILNSFFVAQPPSGEGWVRALISIVCFVASGAINSGTRTYLRRELRK